MIQGLIGKKLGMTQIFDETGLAHPVTVLEAGPCVVTQIKTSEQGWLRGGPARLRSRQAPEQARAGTPPGERIHVADACARSRPTTIDEYEVGQVIKADAFRRGRVGRRDRHFERPWLPGWRQAPWLPRRSEDARSIGPPPRSGLDRFQRHAGTRLQGNADGRTHGQRRVTVRT